MTQEERLFRELAQSAGKSKSDYARMLLLKGETPAHPTPISYDVLTLVKTDFGRIGSNINQCAQRLNEAVRVLNELNESQTEGEAVQVSEHVLTILRLQAAKSNEMMTELKPLLVELKSMIASRK